MVASVETAREATREVEGKLLFATPNPVVKTVEPRPVHVIPSVLVAMLFPPVPRATHKLFAYVTPYPEEVKTVEPRPVHEVPFVLVAMVFPP